MKLARLFGIALVAVLAIGAVAASTASAIPKFELPITLRGITSLSLTSVLRAFTAEKEGNTVTCTHDQVVGTIIDDDEVFAKVHFLNCSIIVEEKGVARGPCTIKSAGSSEGLILTELLRGLLGLLHSPAGAAAILFHPNTGRVFVTLAETGEPCKSIETAVEGAVAGLITTGKSSTAKITLSTTGTGFANAQEIKEILVLSGLIAKVSLKAFGSVTSTEETTDLVQYEEVVGVD
jgi:hypothetical protein